MIIITNDKGSKKNLSEADRSFEVDYWGEKVIYDVRKTASGKIYYTTKNADKAAKMLALKAEKLFLSALTKAGLPRAVPGSFTSGRFIPEEAHTD